MHVQKKGEGQGHINHWGFSPALDLGKAENFNLIGTGCPRNVLYTLHGSNLERKIEQNFNVIETQYDLIARQMLLLAIALDRDNYSLKEKVGLFVEVYGNTLVRSVTLDKLDSMLNTLIQAVTDDDYLARRFPAFDLSDLRQKDRDALENVFLFWRTQRKKTEIDIEKMWDSRLRTYLGTRYDYAQGAYDWDLNMRLVDELKIKQVTKIEYHRWRHTGVAFENHVEGAYKSVNRTLASGRVFSATNARDKSYRTGYWGDIITSPLISYGVDSRNSELLKLGNSMPTHSSEMITEWNLSALFYELDNPGLVYKEAASGDETEIATIVEVDEVEEGSSAVHGTERTKYRDGSRSIPINAKIKFLTQDLYKKCLEKGKIGSNSTTFCSVIFDHTLVDPLLKISDKLIFERPTFLFDVVNKELRENWSSKVELLCAESKLKRSKMKGDTFQSYEVYS